jgi:Asp-tRNA(Asn)/Glu-tRNA(Gln) amidotransferase C subunit
MKTDKTPQPGSEGYDVLKTQDLNTPKYNSTSDKKASGDLPALENSNDQLGEIDTHNANDTTTPPADLGNKREDDEKERERIIRR